MRAREELVERCVRRRAERLGGLSDEAMAELRLDVAAHVDDFVDTPEEQAFSLLGRALDAYATPGDEDYLDDDAWMEALRQRDDVLRGRCEEALRIDPGCTDARLVHDQLEPGGPESVLASLRGDFPATDGLGAWDDVFARPRLRAEAAIARACLASTRYRTCVEVCERVLAAMPADEQGARHTEALALVRLEDEAGFDRLDRRFGRQGSAWLHLARVLLMYKLDRPSATRRALRGYDRLVTGGAYALLRPILPPPHLPDRLEAEPGSFEEAILAASEAEPVIADVPNFVWWCQDEGWFLRSARRFADENGYDWDEDY